MPYAILSYDYSEKNYHCCELCETKLDYSKLTRITLEEKTIENLIEKVKGDK